MFLAIFMSFQVEFTTQLRQCSQVVLNLRPSVLLFAHGQANVEIIYDFDLAERRNGAYMQLY